jgi:hypothetical protein
MDGIVMKKERWLIKLTDEQLHCIMRGMEYYHRMMCGEIDNVDIVCEHRIYGASFKTILKDALFEAIKYCKKNNLLKI